MYYFADPGAERSDPIRLYLRYSQVAWLRGRDQDRKSEAPETLLPEVAAQTTAIVIQAEPLLGRQRKCSRRGWLIHR